MAKRDYSLDNSDDFLTKAAILLFPSPTGSLNSFRAQYKNFTNFFFHNNLDENFDKRNINIKNLAEMVLKILKNEKYMEITYQKNKTKNPILNNPQDNLQNNAQNNKKTLTLEENNARFYNVLGSLMLRTNIMQVYKDSNLKLLLIHAYAMDILNTKEEYEAYLTTLLEGIDDEIRNNLEILKFDQEKIEFFRELYTLNFESFPYSNSRQPAQNDSVPCIDTKNRQRIIVDNFKDCVEIAILHLCNCLFFDNNLGLYNLDHLKLENDSPLKEFYTNLNYKTFTITPEVRIEWSKVLQCLENDINSNSFNDLFPQNIYYNKPQYNNELFPGFINIMNVLQRICSSPNNKIHEIYTNLMYVNDISASNILSKFEVLLNAITVPENKIKCERTQIEKRGISRVCDGKFLRNDFFGNFNVEIKGIKKGITQEQEITTIIKLSIVDIHFQFEFVDRIEKKLIFRLILIIYFSHLILAK